MKEGYIIREQDKAHFITVIAQSRETLRSGAEHHYVKNTYYNGKSKTVPRVSFTQNTAVSKKDVQKIITNNNKKNESNRKNAK
jgi:hypothetical protein